MHRRIAMIGYGAIGREIGEALRGLGQAESLVAVLVREGRHAAPFQAVHSIEALVDHRPGVIVECAGHAAVADYGPAALSKGVNVVLSSVGALADDRVVSALRRASSDGGGRLFFAAGAVAGLDGLIAAKLAGLRTVIYTSFKPPHAWRGTAAEAAVDLDHPDLERVFFQGTAREAALAYPKNANVAVAVGLCGLGLDRTQTRLTSSRRVDDPLGVIQAEGDFGRMTFEILARATTTNPKTSRLTAYSLLQCAQLGIGLPALDLIDGEQGIVGYRSGASAWPHVS